MMSLGMHTAFHEITLVLFTTLAPSGAFGLVLVAAVLVFGKLDVFERKRVNKFLCIPLIIAMIGLIASATHLGNPSNALYVLTGIGRSPLSNEVFAAIVFLMLSGVYWLYGFTLKPHYMVQRVWLICIMISGLVFITSVAFAYDSHTIISWSTVYVPINLWLNACVGGPLLALLTLQLARIDLNTGWFGKGMCLVSAVSLVANIAVISLQNGELSSLANGVTSASELVPYSTGVLVAFLVLSAIGIILYSKPLFSRKKPRLPVAITACTLVLVGIFATRFTFYAMHLTSGIGI